MTFEKTGCLLYAIDVSNEKGHTLTHFLDAFYNTTGHHRGRIDRLISACVERKLPRSGHLFSKLYLGCASLLVSIHSIKLIDFPDSGRCIYYCDNCVLFLEKFMCNIGYKLVFFYFNNLAQGLQKEHLRQLLSQERAYEPARPHSLTIAFST